MRPILPPGWAWDPNDSTVAACVTVVGMLVQGETSDEVASAAWAVWEKHSGISRAEYLDNLTFKQLRVTNVERCNSGAFNHNLEGWPPEMYAMAIAGEVGELCNAVKKMIRNLPTDNVTVKDIEDEVADIQCYLDLFAARMDINLAEVVRRKFNEVSTRVGSDIVL